jgi:hypothetical protein
VAYGNQHLLAVVAERKRGLYVLVSNNDQMQEGRTIAYLVLGGERQSVSYGLCPRSLAGDSERSGGTLSDFVGRVRNRKKRQTVECITYRGIISHGSIAKSTYRRNTGFGWPRAAGAKISSKRVPRFRPRQSKVSFPG